MVKIDEQGRWSTISPQPRKSLFVELRSRLKGRIMDVPALYVSGQTISGPFFLFPLGQERHVKFRNFGPTFSAPLKPTSTTHSTTQVQVLHNFYAFWFGLAQAYIELFLKLMDELHVVKMKLLLLYE